jgi:enoyl-CoA hydratase/carnithine racemase
MTNSDLLSSLEDRIGFITINRPALHNAISRQMWLAIPLLMEELKERGARVIIFSGQGEAFASGADLEELERIRNFDDADLVWSAIKKCLDFVASFELTTIAMIHGACIGGGCLLATACDLRYASITSKFAIPVARLGLILDDETVCRLVNLVGPAHAKALLLSGSTFSSDLAQQFGLVNRTVELSRLRFEVVEFAQMIASNVEDAVTELKRSVNRVAAPARTEIAEREHEKIVASYLTPEFKERVQRKG